MTIPYKLPGIPTLFPYLTVVDAEKSIAFYRQAFQFELKDAPSKQENKIVHAELYFADTVIMLTPEGTWGSTKKAPITTGIEPSIYLYVYVANVDDYFNHATKNGATVIMPPENMFWGDRFCQLRDIDGYEWSFATHIGTEDYSKMPKAW